MPTPGSQLQRITEQQINTNTAIAPRVEDAPALQRANSLDTSAAVHVTATPTQAANRGADHGSCSFGWSECPNLIATDAAGVLVRQPTKWPAVKLRVQFQAPLLFWAERRRWMWHKKWTLPKLHVNVTCDGKPVGGGWAAGMGGLPGEPPVYAVVSAGTLSADSGGEVGVLHDQGLDGETQQRLVGGEATFSSLLFRHTSFNCGNRPFHVVVSVFTPAHAPLAAAALRHGEVGPATADSSPASGGRSPQQMVALACVCSSAVTVDARKRTKKERPEASASDVRLVQRQRGSHLTQHPQSQAQQQNPQPGFGRPPPPGMGPGGQMHPSALAPGQGINQGTQPFGPPRQGSMPQAAMGQQQFGYQQRGQQSGKGGGANGGGPGQRPVSPAGAVAAGPGPTPSWTTEAALEACGGDALIEMSESLVVVRLLSRTVRPAAPM